MKRRVLTARLGAALALMVCLSGTSLPVYGQGSDAKNKLIGTWDVTVTREAAPPGQPLTFPAVFSFLPGRVVLETGSLTAHRSPGHGVWDRAGGRQYTATFQFFRFSPEGQYIGTQNATLTIELAAGGGELTGASAFEIRGPDGAIIATGTTTLEGQRMEIAPQ